MGKWHRKNLGTICHLAYGKNLPTTLFTSEGFKVFGANSIIGYYSKYTHEDAEVLVSCRGEYSGVINFSEPKSYITNNSIVCILKLDLDKLFLFYALKNIPRQTFVSGSAQPQVVIQDLENIELYYPESKPEQTRIAQILSTIDRAIAQTEALIAKYQRIKTGLMQDLLTRGIDEYGRIRSKATHRFVVKNGIEVPEEWEVEPASNLLYVLNGGTPSTSVKEYWENGSIPWLSVDDFNNGQRYVFTTSKHITKAGLVNSATQILSKNSIIISARGTVGVISQLARDMSFNQSCYGLTSKDAHVISNDYLYYILKQVFTFGKVAKSGSVFDTITRKTFDEILIPYPNKQSEINKIVDILSLYDKLLLQQKENHSKLISLKTGLMQDLLSGRVRVKVKEEAAAC